MLTVIVVLFYLFIVLFDLIPIVKSGKKKESVVYSALLAVSFVVLILYNFDIKVPGPTELIKNIIDRLFYAQASGPL